MPDLRSLKRRWERRFSARPQEEEQGGPEQRRGKWGERGGLRRNRSPQLKVLPRQTERGHGGGGQPLEPRTPTPPSPPQGPGARQDQRGGQAGQELGSHPVRPLDQEAVAGPPLPLRLLHLLLPAPDAAGAVLADRRPPDI